MNILIIILIIISFALSVLAVLSYYGNAKIKSFNKLLMDPLKYKSIISIIIISGFSLFIVNVFFKEPIFDDPHKKIRYGEKRNLPAMVKEGYQNLIDKNYTDIDI
ncbi:MAG: hypothetical protein ABIJ97_00930, partial [Bacteroidota bacterium]